RSRCAARLRPPAAGVPRSCRFRRRLRGTPAAGGSGTIVASTTDGSAINKAQQDELSDLIDQAGDIDGVSEVMDPYATAAERAEQSQQLTEGREAAESA